MKSRFIILNLALVIFLSACESTPEVSTENTFFKQGDNYDFPVNISFTYPEGWIVDDETTLKMSVRVKSAESTDSCEGPFGMVAMSMGEKSSTLTFDEFVRSSKMYEEGGSMGKIGGALVQTSLAGRYAYKADITGWESFCEDEAYLVEVGDTDYLWIGVFTSKNNPETSGVQQILNSLLLNAD
ncbi:hypothetical protein A2974_02640 [Candidatus Peregrinibacteria bacterium RIFCSPLOWO2_01_FULL_48_20]|nr:MAG: hypothetical protein A2974_02640 [Candidatus Peregrinibacteria bacterium RIFCSPLOWO2_01_FULL_48_20]